MKKIISVVLSLMISAIFLTGCVSGKVDDPLRLHVIANSDSREDQRVKLEVRDEILEYTANSADDFTSKEAVKKYVQENTQELEQITDNLLKEEGFDYTSHIEVGNFYFPDKTYGDVTYEAGYYDGVKVVLGDGEGQNWWCVIFPPLCLISVSDENQDVSGIDNEKIVYKCIFDK